MDHFSQLLVIYINKFETIMGDYKNSEGVTNHIWDSLEVNKDGESIEIHYRIYREVTITNIWDTPGLVICI